ncbi:serine/threonine protein kinase [Brevundimonas sp. DWR2-3-1b1]|uniref:serine/threonine protein kinase n=1 Tax=unclassified Brevundimonas TaxID=2622653 RepID=UPI003CE8802E
MSLDGVWSDAATWKDRWEKVETLEGGGQGEAFRVRRKDDGHSGFLKIIKSKNAPERRARFFREANAYDTFRVGGVPGLIESNAQHHADLAYTPYLVSDFVEGPTLGKWRASEAHVSLEAAVVLTRALLDILNACHREGCVHRDVKPDNIILAGGDPANPILLDFGLNFHEAPAIEFTTEDGQEVGNRFLRLPELSAGSRLKQDPRSDVSFAAGILFYALTGDHPDLLSDAQGKLPHQRSKAHALLQTAAGDRFQRLVSIFDHAFASMLDDRFTDAEAMLSQLDRLMRDVPVEGSLEDAIGELAEFFDTPAERRLGLSDAAIRNGLQAVQRAYNDLIARISGTLVAAQTNFNVYMDRGENTLFLTRKGSNQYLLKTTYEVQVVGDELVLRISGGDVYRTPLSEPVWDEAFTHVVGIWLTAKLKVALGPNALPIEAEHFRDQSPLSTLTEAAAEAKRTDRRILAFVYDPTQEGLGRLDHALGAFLRNRRTRDRMNHNFVTALVPMSQLMAVSELLNEESMETARWVVLDADVGALEHAVIYDNAEVAEKQMADLAARHAMGQQ